MVVMPARGRAGWAALFGKFSLEASANVGILLGNKVSIFSIDFDTVTLIQLSKAFHVHPVGNEGAIWARVVEIIRHALLRVPVFTDFSGPQIFR